MVCSLVKGVRDQENGYLLGDRWYNAAQYKGSGNENILNVTKFDAKRGVTTGIGTLPPLPFMGPPLHPPHSVHLYSVSRHSILSRSILLSRLAPPS